MNAKTTHNAVLIVSHGSPRADANEGFAQMVARIAARLEGLTVLPAFFSIARPSIADRVRELAAQGAERIVLLPYFLHNGQHIRGDIPGLLEACRKEHPALALELLPTLEGDPILEEILADRLAEYLPAAAETPMDGRAIERASFEIIERPLQRFGIVDPAVKAIVRRVVHATADVSFARSLRIHPEAPARAAAAFAAGKPLICDVKMLKAGLTHAPVPVICALEEAQACPAGPQGGTRTAAAMERMADRWAGAIVAIGNAPTALWKVIEIAARGGPRPALVIGLPVGFVGARESKLALIRSDLCHIGNIGARGGSPAAAAAVNALADLFKEH